MTPSKRTIKKFNIRVYGICIKDSKLLLVKENMNGIEFTKFPGGGLEFGEGLIDGLRREIMEEMELEAIIKQHFYTTDFFQQSAFYKTEQLISIYFFIELVNCPDFKNFPINRFHPGNHSLTFFWEEIESLMPETLTFPIDKRVATQILLSNFE